MFTKKIKKVGAIILMSLMSTIVYLPAAYTSNADYNEDLLQGSYRRKKDAFDLIVRNRKLIAGIGALTIVLCTAFGGKYVLQNNNPKKKGEESNLRHKQFVKEGIDKQLDGNKGFEVSQKVAQQEPRTVVTPQDLQMNSKNGIVQESGRGTVEVPIATVREGDTIPKDDGAKVISEVASDRETRKSKESPSPGKSGKGKKTSKKTRTSSKQLDAPDSIAGKAFAAGFQGWPGKKRLTKVGAHTGVHASPSSKEKDDVVIRVYEEGVLSKVRSDIEQQVTTVRQVNWSDEEGMIDVGQKLEAAALTAGQTEGKDIDELITLLDKVMSAALTKIDKGIKTANLCKSACGFDEENCIAYCDPEVGKVTFDQVHECITFKAKDGKQAHKKYAQLCFAAETLKNLSIIRAKG